MSSLSAEEIDHLAKLSRLSLSESEREKLPDELSKITEFVDQLKAADITDFTGERTESVGLNELREDQEASTTLSLEELARLAPKWRDNKVEIPAVFGENNDV